MQSSLDAFVAGSPGSRKKPEVSKVDGSKAGGAHIPDEGGIGVGGVFDPMCAGCRLSENRTMVVPGNGPADAPLILIGEAPGDKEDKGGEPFIGRAGALLTQELSELGIERSSIYITNTVKCRPPKNRTPRKDEMVACRRFLEREFSHLSPRVVLCLGRTPTKALLGHDVKMAEAVGSVHEVTLGEVSVTAVIGYHPAACLYNPNNLPEFKRALGIAVERAKQ